MLLQDRDGITRSDFRYQEVNPARDQDRIYGHDGKAEASKGLGPRRYADEINAGKRCQPEERAVRPPEYPQTENRKTESRNRIEQE